MAFAKCKDWHAPNAKADEWASKLVLVEKPHGYGGGPYIELKNAPCWKYVWRDDATGLDAITKILTTYSGGCWYGVCMHHAHVYTAIFQERVKGQYHTVSGYHIKAVAVGDDKHAWVELFIKDLGYYRCDVCMPQKMVPRSHYGGTRGKMMCNRWITGNKWRGTAPYQWLWAGPEIAPPPKKTGIKATSSPSNASIWLKKH